MTCAKLNIDHKIVELKNLKNIMYSSLTTDDKIPEGHYTDETMKKTVVPNRNMVMISIAVSYAITIGATSVFYAAHSGDHTIYPDCRPEFIDALNKAIQICDWHRIELRAPYSKLDKSNIIMIGKQLDVDYSLTWTCYNGRDKACGKCGSCVERLEAFKKAGMKDPIQYEDDICL